MAEMSKALNSIQNTGNAQSISVIDVTPGSSTRGRGCGRGATAPNSRVQARGAGHGRGWGQHNAYLSSIT